MLLAKRKESLSYHHDPTEFSDFPFFLLFFLSFSRTNGKQSRASNKEMEMARKKWKMMKLIVSFSWLGKTFSPRQRVSESE